MGEINKTQTKHLASGKRKKGIALASFILGIAPLVALMLLFSVERVFRLLRAPNELLFSAIILSIICGIIVSIKSASSKTKKSLALASFVSGIISVIFLIFLILAEELLLDLSVFNWYTIVVSSVFAVAAIICGILALIKKENKTISLMGIVLALLVSYFWWQFALLLILVFFAPIPAIICGIIALIKKENKPFSLVGIVLAILTLWFFWSTLERPTSHRVPATKAGLAGLKAGISLCCATPGNTLNDNLTGADGIDICSDAIGTEYPTAYQLQADGVSYTGSDCSVGTITATVVHSKKECNGDFIITETRIIVPPGC